MSFGTPDSWENNLEVPGTDPGASRMRSEHPTTELHSHESIGYIPNT